jgi:hypothetical protein
MNYQPHLEVTNVGVLSHNIKVVSSILPVALGDRHILKTVIYENIRVDQCSLNHIRGKIAETKTRHVHFVTKLARNMIEFSMYL